MIEHPDHPVVGASLLLSLNDLRDKVLGPITTATVTFTAFDPDGLSVSIPSASHDPVSDDWYASFIPTKAGVYEIRVEAVTPGGAVLRQGTRKRVYEW